MNEYQRELYALDHVETVLCAVCRSKRATNRHHVVPRSQGGTNGCTITLCGNGNISGCHGLAHNHYLHFRANNGELEYLLTCEPMKDESAYKLDGWRKVTREI